MNLHDENAFRYFLVAVSIIQTAISVRYLTRSKAGRTIFQRRAEGMPLSIAIVVFYLSYLAGVLTYFVNPGWMAWSAVEVPSWSRWIGAVPTLVGAAWMIWGLHELGTNLTISVSTRKEHRLVTSGPYGWVRHPLYVGGMIESLGIALLMANWSVAVSAALFWGLIAYRTPLEEAKLIEKFGDDYQTYMTSVGRFVPSLR